VAAGDRSTATFKRKKYVSENAKEGPSGSSSLLGASCLTRRAALRRMHRLFRETLGLSMVETSQGVPA
jgi:hypothetical protein